jgi:predicted nucleotidyltransferase
LADVLRDELAPLASKIKVAAVFGSIAGGAETSGSDIDLLVIGSVKMIELVPLLERATERVGRPINPALYTPGEFPPKVRTSHFLQSVLGKPLLFVLGNQGDLSRMRVF